MFEDIRELDFVSAPVSAKDMGWGKITTFFLPRKVTRVTPKRFHVEGFSHAFKKIDGSRVSGGDCNDTIKPLYERPSQVEAYNDHVQKINCIHRIDAMLDDREINYKKIHDMNSDDAFELEKALREIQDKFKIFFKRSVEMAKAVSK